MSRGFTLILTFLIFAVGTNSDELIEDDALGTIFDPSENYDVPSQDIPPPIETPPEEIGQDPDEVTETPYERGPDYPLPTGDVGLPDMTPPPALKTIGITNGPNIEESRKDASNGLAVEVYDISKSIADLSRENEEYEDRIRNMEGVLQDTVGRLSQMRVNEMLVEQILEPPKVDRKMRKVVEEQESEQPQEELQQVERKQTEVEEDEQLDISDAMLYAIGFGFAFLILSTLRMMLGMQIEKFLQPALYQLFISLTVLALICCVCTILEYNDLIDQDNVYFTKLTVGIGIFLGLWFLLGLILILVAQFYHRQWNQHEIRCIDLPDLEEQYQREFQECEKSGKFTKSCLNLQQGIQYAVMRFFFIYPIYLPTATESFMREDFNFSSYLSLSICQKIVDTFYISWPGYGLIILGVIIGRYLLFNVEFAILTIFALILPLLILLSLYLLQLKLDRIYYQLVPRVSKPNQIPLPKDLDSNKNHKPTQIPEYLQGSISNINNTENNINICGKSIHPLKMTCQYIFHNQFPNRHQLLFWFDSYGPGFFTCIVQACSILLCMWLTIILIHATEEIWEELSWGAIAFLIISIALWLFSSAQLIPKYLKYLTLTTCIEQMKDRNSITEVVIAEKNKRILRAVRLYRQLKMIYRDFEQPMPRSTIGSMGKLINEAFYLVAQRQGTRDQLHIQQLDEALTLCGIRLQEDELRLFAKECNPIDFTYITVNNFKTAVLQILKSVKLDPNNVIFAVLFYYFQEMAQRISLEDKVSLINLQEFLMEYNMHFMKEDIDEIIWAFKHLADSKGKVKVEDVVGMIRSQIEGFAI